MHPFLLNLKFNGQCSAHMEDRCGVITPAAADLAVVPSVIGLQWHMAVLDWQRYSVTANNDYSTCRK